MENNGIKNGFKIEREPFVRIVLAMSLLKGDLTGRGDMLTDHDEKAIEEVIDYAVGKVLAESGYEFKRTRSGWKVDATADELRGLLPLLPELVLRAVAGVDTTKEPLLGRCPGFITPYYA